jgi:hypothetical protein
MSVITWIHEFNAAPAGALPRNVFRYVLGTSGLHQLFLLALTVSVFLLEVVPLELQRRIVNNLVKHRPFSWVVSLCAVYVGIVLVQGGTKLALNIYRGWVGERAKRELRRRVHTFVETGAHARDELGFLLFRRGALLFHRRAGPEQVLQNTVPAGDEGLEACLSTSKSNANLTFGALPNSRTCRRLIAGRRPSAVLLDRGQSHLPINAFGRVSVITVEVAIGGTRQGTFERFGRDVEGHSLQGQSTLDHELLHNSSLC